MKVDMTIYLLATPGPSDFEKNEMFVRHRDIKKNYLQQKKSFFFSEFFEPI